MNLPNTVRIATVSSQGHTGFDSENNAVSADLADAKNYMEKKLYGVEKHMIKRLQNLR